VTKVHIVREATLVLSMRLSPDMPSPPSPHPSGWHFWENPMTFFGARHSAPTLLSRLLNQMQTVRFWILDTPS